jgi:hypothetical protein
MVTETPQSNNGQDDLTARDREPFIFQNSNIPKGIAFEKKNLTADSINIEIIKNATKLNTMPDLLAIFFSFSA